MSFDTENPFGAHASTIPHGPEIAAAAKSRLRGAPKWWDPDSKPPDRGGGEGPHWQGLFEKEVWCSKVTEMEKLTPAEKRVKMNEHFTEIRKAHKETPEPANISELREYYQHVARELVMARYFKDNIISNDDDNREYEEMSGIVDMTCEELQRESDEESSSGDDAGGNKSEKPTDDTATGANTESNEGNTEAEVADNNDSDLDTHTGDQTQENSGNNPPQASVSFNDMRKRMLLEELIEVLEEYIQNPMNAKWHEEVQDRGHQFRKYIIYLVLDKRLNPNQEKQFSELLTGSGHEVIAGLWRAWKERCTEKTPLTNDVLRALRVLSQTLNDPPRTPLGPTEPVLQNRGGFFRTNPTSTYNLGAIPKTSNKVTAQGVANTMPDPTSGQRGGNQFISHSG